MASNSIKITESVSLTIEGDVLKVADHRTRSRANRRSCCGLRKHKEPVVDGSIALYNVLDAQIQPAASTLTITYVDTSSPRNSFVNALQYSIAKEEQKAVSNWAATLLDLAYGDAKPYKRLKVLVNPFSGRGDALETFKTYAEPVFAAAHCYVDIETTRHKNHASDIAEGIDHTAYDAIVCCSGDGLPHEVLNGLGRKSNALQALRQLALAMIPCGSGNAMAWNLYGTDDPALSALAIVKGRRMSLDLASVTHGDKPERTLSFLLQSFGLIAHSDLGTESLRWMGDTRFFVGVLDCLVNSRVNFPCDLAMKVTMDDKDKISDHYHSHVEGVAQQKQQDTDHDLSELTGGLPSLMHGTVLEKLPEDWEVIPAQTLGTFFASKMAIVSKDSNFFPAALPNDGLLDVITVDGAIGFIPSLMVSLSVSNDNKFFHHPNVSVRKVTAYRLVPCQRDGYISVDGERLPFEPFQVEVHRGLGTVLSKSGFRYEAKGPAKPSSSANN